MPTLDTHPNQVLYDHLQKAYWKNRLSKVTNRSVQTLSLTSTPPPMLQGIQIKLHILLVQFVNRISVPLNALKWSTLAP